MKEDAQRVVRIGGHLEPHRRARSRTRPDHARERDVPLHAPNRAAGGTLKVGYRARCRSTRPAASTRSSPSTCNHGCRRRSLRARSLTRRHPSCPTSPSRWEADRTPRAATASCCARACCFPDGVALNASHVKGTSGACSTHSGGAPDAVLFRDITGAQPRTSRARRRPSPASRCSTSPPSSSGSTNRAPSSCACSRCVGGHHARIRGRPPGGHRAFRPASTARQGLARAATHLLHAGLAAAQRCLEFSVLPPPRRASAPSSQGRCRWSATSTPRTCVMRASTLGSA